MPPGAGSPCRAQPDCATIGLAHFDQLPPSATSRKIVAADAVLVRLTWNENFLPDMG